MKRLLLAAAALAAAVAALVGLTIPPGRIELSRTDDGTVAGIVHVHTNRSDGLSSPDEIAAAAVRAGVKFLVFTDHGDATRTPDPPAYRAGVLCLDAVEISTTGGHYLALDMPAAPYPLGGEPRDVVEDVARLGGFGVAAHPDSPKPGLRWREWTAPFDGIEWINLDTSWRVRAQWPGARAKLRLFEALIDYPIRPAETIARLLPGTSDLYRWDALSRRRRVVALAGADAHAKLTLKNVDPGDNRYSLPIPSYESAFRALSIHVRTEHPLGATSGSAAADAAMVMRGIRAGHVYTVVDAVASPASFDFTATNSRGTAHAGDELRTGGAVTLRVRSNAPPEFTTVIWQGLKPLTPGGHGQDVAIHVTGEPSVYRAEIRSAVRRHMPQLQWVVSNPIYVRPPPTNLKLPIRPPATHATPIFDGRTPAGWRVEHDPASLATFDVAPAVTGGEIGMRYTLDGAPTGGQFAALLVDLPGGVAPNDRLTLRIRAEHPMRISVQQRAPSTQQSTWRWQRSIYVDTEYRERTVFFDDLMPVGNTDTWRPPLADIRSILFVVDTTNTKAGSSGRFWITNAVLQN